MRRAHGQGTESKQSTISASTSRRVRAPTRRRRREERHPLSRFPPDTAQPITSIYRSETSSLAAPADGHERHVPISIWARLHLGGAGRLSSSPRLASRSRPFLPSLPSRESLKVSPEFVAVTVHMQSLFFASTVSLLQSGRLMLDHSHLFRLQSRPQRSQPELPTWAEAPGWSWDSHSIHI